LAIWIFATIEILTGIKIITEILGKILVRKAVLWVDGISFYVFITHYIFIDGPLRILGLTSYSFLNATLLIVIITAVSILLKKISSFVGNWMNIRSGMV
jgi:peptidoglycan/LPS O-acetylase OafA/YrhL